MSEKMTQVSLPGTPGAGFANWGDRDPLEMISQLRRQAQKDLEVAQAILSAPDTAFIVQTYRGPYAMQNRKVIWPEASA